MSSQPYNVFAFLFGLISFAIVFEEIGSDEGATAFAALSLAVIFLAISAFIETYNNHKHRNKEGH